jgi:hypothetical protein
MPILLPGFLSWAKDLCFFFFFFFPSDVDDGPICILDGAESSGAVAGASSYSKASRSW